MRQNMCGDKTICSHCGNTDYLEYYKEANDGKDLYFCAKCYGLFSWDGKFMESIAGEAYPNRDKFKKVKSE